MLRRLGGGHLPKARLETLVDGTAAIVLTLLILDIKVPHVPVGELPAALLDMKANLFAYAVSVLVVGVFWQGHVQQFNFLTKVDRVVIGLNVVGLGLLAFVPFTTALLGEYLGESLPSALYGLNLVLLGLLAILGWLYSTSGRRCVREDLPEDVVRGVLGRTAAGVAIGGAGVIVAFFSAWAALAVYALAFLPFAIPARYERHLEAR